jgi:hypothetical protein
MQSHGLGFESKEVDHTNSKLTSKVYSKSSCHRSSLEVEVQAHEINAVCHV